MQVVIVDDHPMICEALRGLAGAGNTPFELVGEAASARRCLELVEERHPDVVVMDLFLPGLDGVEATREIVRKHPLCRVLVYTARREAWLAVESLEAGAKGYALKADPVEDFLAALDEVGHGRTYVSPSMRRDLDELRSAGASVGLSALSRRERELFDLILAGYTNAQLAQRLCISVKTVETHRTRINRKLGVHSTPQLMRYAARNGLVFS